MKGPTTQSIKLFINTHSVRDSRLGKESSVAGSNRYSFHSMVPGQVQTSSRVTVGASDELDRLKSEIDYLEKQRLRLSKDIDGRDKNAKGGIVKYVLLLGAGLVAGNLTSKYTGLNEYIKNNISGPPTPVPVSEEEGFFSIFNFGG